MALMCTHVPAACTGGVPTHNTQHTKILEPRNAPVIYGRGGRGVPGKNRYHVQNVRWQRGRQENCDSMSRGTGLRGGFKRRECVARPTPAGFLGLRDRV